MKLLLDTHVFIWWANEPEKLSQKALAGLLETSNDLILSVVSAWEIQIKIQLGKLRLRQSLAELVKSQRETNELQILPLELGHVLTLDTLPFHHKDPFDRLLIAQCVSERLTLVTADDSFSAYSVKLL
jgi:PIN domain nuclease of toxin-antitoxin system